MSSGKTKYGVSEQAPMGWSELRDGLADHLPAGVIHLNKRFSQLQQHENHVELHFTDGTSVDAKIVVGADGCFSKVRQQTLGDGLPDFTVSCLSHIQLLLQGWSPHTYKMDWLPVQRLGLPYATGCPHMTDCLAHLILNSVMSPESCIDALLWQALLHSCNVTSCCCILHAPATDSTQGMSYMSLVQLLVCML